jgi:hypothetical protein
MPLEGDMFIIVLKSQRVIFLAIVLVVTLTSLFIQAKTIQDIEKPFEISQYLLNKSSDIVAIESDRYPRFNHAHKLRRDYFYNISDRDTEWLRNGAFLIDTNIVYSGPAGGNQDYPAIAFDGTNYLVVWLDTRTGNQYDIYGARVSPSGVVLDTAGIAISTVEGYKFWPAVAFDGTNYLVVWMDECVPTEQDIYGARVSPSGTVLDPDGFPISTAYDWQTDPTVAFDGTNYLVVWADFRNDFWDFDLYGARVSPSGIVLDPDGFPISTAESGQGDHVLIFDGTNYFIVWDDQRNHATSGVDVYGSRITPSCTVLDPDGIAISTEMNGQGCPAVAFDGANYLIVWTDMRSGTYDICCSRVNQSGVVLDTPGIPISSTGDTWQWFLSVGFDGTNYLVVWQDEQPGTEFDLYGARVDTSGFVLDTPAITISSEVAWQWNPAIAFDSTNYLVVWDDFRSLSSLEIYGTRIDQSGTVLDPEGIVISIGINFQELPSIAFDGSHYMVVWQDHRNGSFDICGARVDQSGTILDPAGIAISDTGDEQKNPAIAFDGTNYLVVWQDTRNDSGDIYGSRVNQSGIILDTTGISISTAMGRQFCPAIAFDGANYLVVWQDTSSISCHDIYGTRVTPSGIVLDPDGFAISTAYDWQGNPTVASDGANYFVVWHDYRNNPLYTDIYGARVNQSGTVLDPDGIAISTAEKDQFYPIIAFDGSNYLIAWHDYRDDPGTFVNSDIYGARVNPSGVVLDTAGIPICIAPDRQTGPSVAFDGTEYLVVWESSHDLYGSKVNTAGMVTDFFAVSLQLGNQVTPAIARGIDDQLLITYSGWTDFINTHPINTTRIWGIFSTDVGIEDDGEFNAYTTEPYFSVYPNPSFGSLMITLTSFMGKQIELDVYDECGRFVQTLFSGSVDNESKTFTTGLPTGVYFVKLTEKEHTQVTKFVVVH